MHAYNCSSRTVFCCAELRQNKWRHGLIFGRPISGKGRFIPIYMQRWNSQVIYSFSSQECKNGKSSINLVVFFLLKIKKGTVLFFNIKIKTKWTEDRLATVVLFPFFIPFQERVHTFSYNERLVWTTKLFSCICVVTKIILPMKIWMVGWWGESLVEHCTLQKQNPEQLFIYHYFWRKPTVFRKCWMSFLFNLAYHFW